ncbi:MAG: glycosyltransferase family 2 protein [Planctomycetota bacterium]
MTDAVPQLSVVIPAFNEVDGVEHLAATLERLERALAERGTSAEYLIVDDASRDGTGARLREVFAAHPRVVLLEHAQNQGFGGAFRTGAHAARAPLIACYDFDCTYPVEDVLRLLDALEAHGADVATASPFQPGGEVQGVSPARLLQSKAASALYRVTLGRSARGIHTFSCAFRVYRREVLLGLPPWSDRFLAAAEILAHCVLQGRRVVEIPSVLSQRQFGESKLRRLPTTLAHLRMLGWLGVGRLRRKLLR